MKKKEFRQLLRSLLTAMIEQEDHPHKPIPPARPPVVDEEFRWACPPQTIARMDAMDWLRRR